MSAEITPAVARAAKENPRAYGDWNVTFMSGQPVEPASVYVSRRTLAAALDVEEITRVLGEHRIECTGLEGVTCRGCRERGWMSRYAFEQHHARALVAALLGADS